MAHGSPARAAHLAHLDGLRAIASLYVVLFHAVVGFQRGELHGAWRLLRRLCAFGHEAVAVFIVLSGYCLMLPVVERGGGFLPRSVSSFFARRAFRILPPYYATLLLSLMLIRAIPLLGTPSPTIWNDSLPAFEPGAVLSHVLLVHNWFPSWAYRINGPLWSVASEWQIYFFFPLLLLPLWRRFGALAMLAVAACVGYAPLWLFPAAASCAIPWYLLLFALGMQAAAINRLPREFEKRMLESVDWRLVAAACWALCAIGGLAFGGTWFRLKPWADLLLGLSTASLLVHLTRSSDRSQPSKLCAWLSSPAVVTLGHFSYSLYLTHLPVLALCYFWLARFGLPAQTHALCMLALGTPTSLGVAYAFYVSIERRCIGQPPPKHVLARAAAVIAGALLAVSLLALAVGLMRR